MDFEENDQSYQEEILYSDNEGIIDLSELNLMYNVEDEPEVADILTLFGFEAFIQLFKDEQIDMEAFRNLNDSIIVELLKNLPKGIVTKFLMRHKQWTKNTEVFARPMSTEDKKKIHSNIVEEILQSTTEGKKFLQSIDKTRSFVPQYQKQLRGLLLGHFLDSQITLSKREIEDLSRQISVTFPFEDANCYFNPAIKTGPLYIEHNNKVHQLRKMKVFPPSESLKSSKKRKIDEIQEVLPEIISFRPTPQEIESDELIKLQGHDTDLQTYLQHWRSSARIRLKKILDLQPDDKITSIIQEYSAYKRADGAMLISIDYDAKHNSSPAVPSEVWSRTSYQIINYIQKEIKNEATITQIESLFKQTAEITENQRNVMILVGLHAALYSRQQVHPAAKLWKVTLPEAYKFMVLHCKTENSLDIEIEKRRKLVTEKKATFQPLIAVFGDTFETLIDKFCIIFEDIKYYSGNFITALITLLKIYEVFGLAFPGPSTIVHQFLRALLLGLQNNRVHSKVLNLVKLLNQSNP